MSEHDNDPRGPGMEGPGTGGPNPGGQNTGGPDPMAGGYGDNRYGDARYGQGYGQSGAFGAGGAGAGGFGGYGDDRYSGGGFGGGFGGGGASSRLLDDLARLMTDAAGVAQGARREVETVMRSQAERFLAGLDLVSREEFEAVREMASRARMENDDLRARIEKLEGAQTPAATPATD